VTLSIGALIVGVFFTIWAVRGWQEGVIVGSSEVTIRNLTSTRKVALGNISSFTLKPSRHKAFVVALVESDGSLKKLPFWSPSMISDDPRNRRFRDFVDQLSNAVKTMASLSIKKWSIGPDASQLGNIVRVPNCGSSNRRLLKSAPRPQIGIHRTTTDRIQLILMSTRNKIAAHIHGRRQCSTAWAD
jgi:hypothetical protein